ncbi:MAG: hypothetical protein AAGK57_00340 [Pseudomonadota bacterium]
MRRRTLLLGGTALLAAAAVPLVNTGISGFLSRVLRDHFGDDIFEVAGIEDFVAEYASLVSQEDWVKRTGAQVYFGLRGDQVKQLGLAKGLENRFLQTILTRSNIIAIRQGRETQFDYSDPDPWAAVCGGYLTAATETIG